jgi:hypothetical protein
VFLVMRQRALGHRIDGHRVNRAVHELVEAWHHRQQRDQRLPYASRHAFLIPSISVGRQILPPDDRHGSAEGTWASVPDHSAPQDIRVVAPE